MDYETGVGLAFLTWLWGLVNLLISVNSQMEKNLNKIGQRLSWVTLSVKEMAAEDQNRPLWKSIGKFLLIAVIGLPFVLLSWVTVFLWLGQIIYRRSKDSGAPQAVREYRWKLRNVDMTLDDIIKEGLKASGKSLDEFEATRETIVHQMRESGLTTQRY